MLVMPSMVAGMGGAFHVGNPAATARRSKPGVAPAPGENVGMSASVPTSAMGGSTSGSPSSAVVPTSFVNAMACRLDHANGWGIRGIGVTYS